MTDTVEFDNSVDPVTDDEFPNITAFTEGAGDDEWSGHDEDDEPQQAAAAEPADD